MVELHPITHLRAAAWVPDDDPERPWDEAADLAADWIWERSEVEGVTPLLVTSTFQNAVGIDCLEEIARNGGQATPQGKQRFDRGPVLAYVPDERSLKFALNLAHGHSLAVVESVSFPLAEWAAGAGAINLLDGSTSSSSLPDDVKADLDHAAFFGGNNGWTGPAREAARPQLPGAPRPCRPSRTRAGCVLRHVAGRLGQGSQAAALAP
jgi:hypothetical protein